MTKDLMTPEARIQAAINLEPVDRVVCAPMIDPYPGMLNKDFMHGWEKCMGAIDRVKEAYPIWDCNPFIGDSRSSVQWLSLKVFENMLLPLMQRLVNGLMFSTGCCMPVNAKHENVKAFFGAVEKYGMYN